MFLQVNSYWFLIVKFDYTIALRDSAAALSESKTRILQVSRMYTARIGKAGIIVALCAAGVLLGACGPGGQEPNAAAPIADSPVAATETASPGSNAATRLDDTRSVIAEEMPYAEVGDELVYGYFVAPSDMFEPLPAVIMIHEWWGVNGAMHARADRLAAQGYIVLAIDLFGGKTATTPAAARELLLSVVEDPESANENIRSAFKFVSEVAGAPKVGAIGWRFGGTWALNAAMLLPDDIDATVIYYGPVTSDEDKLRPIKGPVLGLFAENDVSVKVASVEAFKAALGQLRKDYDIQIYAGVSQRFADESAKTYDAAAASDAWNRALDFLELHLSADVAATDGS
jgi:carboxymethylenebutenolidase